VKELKEKLAREREEKLKESEKQPKEKKTTIKLLILT
jgi:hypothetical protein